MAKSIEKLKGAGWWTNLFSAFVTIATSWGVIVSALVAFGVWFFKGTFDFLGDQYVRRAGGVFLWFLWSYIGLSILYRLHTGIKTLPHVDYAFGVVVESIGLGVDQADDGNLQPNIQFRNVVNGPIRATPKDIRVIIDGRTNPDVNVGHMMIPRIAQKGVTCGLFKKSDFYGKGKVEGTLDITLEYGPHDGDPVRKLRVKAKLIIQEPPQGLAVWGFANEYISEEDTPI